VIWRTTSLSLSTSNSQGTQRQVVSGAAGEFSLNSVPIGQYTLAISASGFSVATVNAGATSSLKAVKLSLRSAATNVEVNGSPAVLLQTSDCGLSHLCAARSKNGIDGWRIDAEPTLLYSQCEFFQIATLFNRQDAGRKPNAESEYLCGSHQT
jgi:Carboxypeptidase regulatory-like domain